MDWLWSQAQCWGLPVVPEGVPPGQETVPQKPYKSLGKTTFRSPAAGRRCARRLLDQGRIPFLAYAEPCKNALELCCRTAKHGNAPQCSSVLCRAPPWTNIATLTQHRCCVRVCGWPCRAFPPVAVRRPAHAQLRRCARDAESFGPSAHPPNSLDILCKTLALGMSFALLISICG